MIFKCNYASDGFWTITNQKGDVTRMFLSIHLTRPPEKDCNVLYVIVGPFQFGLGWAR